MNLRSIHFNKLNRVTSSAKIIFLLRQRRTDSANTFLVWKRPVTSTARPKWSSRAPSSSASSSHCSRVSLLLKVMDLKSLTRSSLTSRLEVCQPEPLRLVSLARSSPSPPRTSSSWQTRRLWQSTQRHGRRQEDREHQDRC